MLPAMAIDIRRVSAEDTYPIRKQMLRQNAPMEACKFPGDHDDLTFHLGAFFEGKLVSVASFYFENNDSIEAPHQFRLRGMATLPEYHGQGFSSALLRTAIPLIKRSHCDTLWCNARKTALGFYQKVGFEEIGDFFEIQGIGEHKLMLRKIPQ